MRTNGEPVSLAIGEANIVIGHAYAIISSRIEGRSTTRLWFKPYWPGLMHAVALIADGRKAKRAKH